MEDENQIAISAKKYEDLLAQNALLEQQRDGALRELQANNIMLSLDSTLR